MLRIRHVIARMFALGALAAVAAVASRQAVAQIVVTTSAGGGTAIAPGAQDRLATFPTIVEGQSLQSYSEGGLLFTINDPDVVSFLNFDPTGGNGGGNFTSPFHYPSGGANAFTVIRPTDAVDFSALEVAVGTGFQSTTTFFGYEVLNNGVLLTEGAFSLSSGQVVGFAGTGGTVFDELRLGAYNSLAEAEAATATSFQALAIDNVRADVAGVSNVAAPEPATLALLATGLLPVVGAVIRRRRKA